MHKKLTITTLDETVYEGLHSDDARHLACAEQARLDIFLPTDDHMLRLATRHAARLQVRVANPLTWLLGVTESCIRRQ
ncbi:MAG: hypothetical protein FJZ47_22505 [Candidatus Tectomicrobia bacterium]|uniref:PIN domain-containing protein n=1 Tax=Tectimicrobiota bacterium TaxID=2528274 RepID=A0A938B6J4_UNCTE|nr:hypothetical protein [Candidatus Tectomicrobia bacterium]